MSALAVCIPVLNAGTYDFWSYKTNSVDGAWGEAVAIGDLNNDGRKDVVMCTSSYGFSTNRESLLVFYQGASGQLQSPVKYLAGGAAYAVVIADFNGDGLNDVAIGRQTSGIRVFLQDTNGTLQNYADYTTPNAYSLCAGDFNHGGTNDLIAVEKATGKLFLFVAVGTSFPTREQISSGWTTNYRPVL